MKFTLEIESALVGEKSHWKITWRLWALRSRLVCLMGDDERE